MKLTGKINGQTIEIELNVDELVQAKREYDKKRLELEIVDKFNYDYVEYEPLTKKQVEEITEKWVDRVVDDGFNNVAYNEMFEDVEVAIGFDL
jgi:hypothetical protein